MQRSTHFRSGRTRAFVFATIAALVVMSAGLAAASPMVSGPVTGGSGAILPANLNGFDLAQVGYEQSEYFLQGTATAYHPDRTADVGWYVDRHAGHGPAERSGSVYDA